ncbi:MAG: hypothetical protein M1837_001133 [Sclerophora amabilis]|nr:MAG: hypothetical protein M1837_001133 [Sclerophora amabilis]
MISRPVRWVVALIFICFLFFGPIQQYSQTPTDLLEWLWGRTKSPLPGRPKENTLLSFSPATNCTEWLQKSGPSIVYNYGNEDAFSSAIAFRNCLRRDEAAESRNRVQEILVDFYPTGQEKYDPQPLLDFTHDLPNLKLVRWPQYWINHHACTALQQGQSEGHENWSMNFYREDEVPHFLKCNSDSLKVNIMYGTQHTSDIIDRLYDTLVACRNVRSLSLSISQGGCTIGDAPWSFNWKEADRFPDLEDLTVSGYAWISERRISWHESHRPDSVKAWKAAMDWSKMKRLDLSLPPNAFLEAFHGELNSLESLVLRPRWGFWGDEETLCDFDEAAGELRENFTSFIASLPPLRELSISGMGQLLNMTSILQTHGASLEKLSIHEFERDCAYETGNVTWKRPVLSVLEIGEIARASPNLRSLTLDGYRDGDTWPTTTLEALSAISSLSHLSIWFDLKDPRHIKHTKNCFVNEQARDKYCVVPELLSPRLDNVSARRMFRQLRHDQPGSRLQKLTLYAGDFNRREGGGMRIEAHGEYNNAVKYTCWVEEDDLEFCSIEPSRRSLFDDEFDNLEEVDYDGYEFDLL